MTDIDTHIRSLFISGSHPGPVPQKVIQEAEKALDILFPPSYKKFLSLYGAYYGNGIEIYGLIYPSPDPDQPPEWQDVVTHTLRFRPDACPPQSVGISDDGTDFTYWLLCSTVDSAYEGPVVEWGPDNEDGKLFAESFIDFVSRYTRS